MGSPDRWGKFINNPLPTNRQSAVTGVSAQRPQPVRAVGQGSCAVNKLLAVCKRCEHAVVAVQNVFMPGSVIKTDDRQTAGHGFRYNIAKGVGETRKQENIAACKVCGEVFTTLHTATDDFRMLFTDTGQ